MFKADWAARFMEIGAGISSPIALAGFGIACVCAVALAVVISISARFEDRSVNRLKLRVLREMFECTVSTAAIVVLVLVVAYLLA